MLAIDIKEKNFVEKILVVEVNRIIFFLENAISALMGLLPFNHLIF